MRNRFVFLFVTLLTLVQQAWAIEYGSTDISSEEELKDAINKGKKDFCLRANITLSEKLTIGDGSDNKPTVTIDLNGHKLSRSLSANENYGMVIYVNGGTLTIWDSSSDNSGSIEGGRSFNGAGILCESGSTLTIFGVTFRNNDVSRNDGLHGRGGAIYIDDGGQEKFVKFV